MCHGHHAGVGRLVGQLGVDRAHAVGVGKAAPHKVGTRCDHTVFVLCIDGVDAQRGTETVFYQFVGVGSRVGAVVKRCAHAQARHTIVVEAEGVGW